MDKVEKSTVQLIIDGQQSKVSLKEMGVAVKTLKKELREMKEADDPKAWAEKVQHLKQATKAYGDAKDRVRALSEEGKRFKASWKDVFTGFLGGNAVTFVLQTLGNLVTTAKEKIYSMSDSLTDVGRATDQTRSEVRKLNSELSQIDTRTATQDLRDMAIVAGKNGIQKDLAGFVKSTDMINIALGDEFDNVTELTETIIDLRKIFKDIQSDSIEDDVLHIGNAINYLADAGTASGKVMTDFAGRMGGTLIPLGATTGQILGLATTMEELSITAERGSTAVNTIFQNMLTDVENFAKVAGVSTKQFKEMLNKDIWSAFNLFMVGAKNGGKEATEFAKILADVELSGAGASEVILKLSTNQQMLSGYVKDASEQLKQSGSITDEVKKKLANAASVFDWFAKTADRALEKFALFGIGITEAFGQAFGIIDKTEEQLRRLNEQQQKVTRINTELIPLIDRYDELKLNVKKTADEHEELRKITQKIGEIVPGAVTEWDSYGRAMDVNAGKTRAFYKEQRELMAVMRQQRRDLLRSDLETLQKQGDAERNKLKVGKNFSSSGGAGGMLGSGAMVPQKYTDAQYQAQIQKVRAIEDQIDAKEKDLAEILGLLPAGPPGSGPTNKPTIIPVTPKSTSSGSGSSSDSDEKTKKAEKQGESMFTQRHKFEVAEEEYDQKRADQKASYAEAEKVYDQQKLDQLKEYMEAEKEFDQMMAEREARSNYDLTSNALSMAEASGQLTPEDANRAKLDAEDAYLMELYMIRESYGQQTDDLQQGLAEASIERAKLITQTDKENAEQQRQIALTLQTAKMEALEQGVGALKSFFKETSLIYKALFVVEKAAAIANIIIKAQAEIAAQSAYAATMGPVGPAYAAAMAAATKIRAGISIATVAAQSVQTFVPGREEGGFTDLNSLRKSKSAAGYVDQPTLFNLGSRSFIAGENYKKEYVIPYSMLQDPYFAGQAKEMEMYRTTGRHPLSGSGAPGNGNDTSNLAAIMIMQYEESKRLRMALESGSITTVFNTTAFDERQAYVNFIREATSL